jgi:threonine aldolase
MNFASDNAAGIAPEILAAIALANQGHALAYGQDHWTQRLEHRLAEMFEHELAVFLVGTGTAANALALAHLTPPWGAVVCHSESHIATDDRGARIFGGGIKPWGSRERDASQAHALKRILSGRWGGLHHVRPTGPVDLTGTEADDSPVRKIRNSPTLRTRTA